MYQIAFNSILQSSFDEKRLIKETNAFSNALNQKVANLIYNKRIVKNSIDILKSEHSPGSYQSSFDYYRHSQDVNSPKKLVNLNSAKASSFFSQRGSLNAFSSPKSVNQKLNANFTPFRHDFSKQVNESKQIHETPLSIGGSSI